MCKERREKRTDYVPPDVPGFFDEVAWPEYVKHRDFVAENVEDVTFLDGALSLDSVCDTISRGIKRITGFGMCSEVEFLWMKHGVLSTSEASDFATDASCGAISLFIGTTRNNFDGKEVVKLEYDTYDQMALAELKKLCALLRSRFPGLSKICILHRLGEVPVREASVIIAISSPHRAGAMEATKLAIEELKKNVPIWKKVPNVCPAQPFNNAFSLFTFNEVQCFDGCEIEDFLFQEIYSDGSGSWKQNMECTWKN